MWNKMKNQPVQFNQSVLLTIIWKYPPTRFFSTYTAMKTSRTTQQSCSYQEHPGWLCNSGCQDKSLESLASVRPLSRLPKIPDWPQRFSWGICWNQAVLKYGKKSAIINTFWGTSARNFVRTDNVSLPRSIRVVLLTFRAAREYICLNQSEVLPRYDHEYGISAVVPQTSFWEAGLKCLLWHL